MKTIILNRRKVNSPRQFQPGCSNSSFSSRTYARYKKVVGSSSVLVYSRSEHRRKLDNRIPRSVDKHSAPASQKIMSKYRLQRVRRSTSGHTCDWQNPNQFRWSSLPSRSNLASPVKAVTSSRLPKAYAISRHIKLLRSASYQQRSYCIFFNRFGRCSRGVKCKFLHDLSKVAICTRFLRGRCLIEKCPFSHQLCKEKMPVCSFFLKGNCSREECPYVHVKHNQSVPRCPQFDRGYCPKGSRCDKQHLARLKRKRSRGSSKKILVAQKIKAKKRKSNLADCNDGEMAFIPLGNSNPDTNDDEEDIFLNLKNISNFEFVDSIYPSFLKLD